MTGSPRRKLEDIVVESGLLSREQVAEAQEKQKASGAKLARTLVDEGYLSETDLVACLGQQLGMPPIDLSRYTVPEELLSVIPEQMARHYQLLPVSRLGNTLTVVMADPMNVFALDDVRMSTGYHVEATVGSPEDISKALDKYYGRGGFDEDALIDFDEDSVEVESRSSASASALELDDETDSAPVVKVVNMILAESIRQRASDIHIEPFEQEVRVRFRVDGALREAVKPPKRLQGGITARLKIMSGMDISERRVPQDGRFKVRLSTRDIDYRVNALPVVNGEKIVLRALDKSKLAVGLSDLGFDPTPLAALEKAVAQPYGMILVTGPTGSGKSTTLYSVLARINTPEVNIVTVEDPVEYQVEGITQVQVHHEIGLSFSECLRSILRQTPDVIMVGEIRDQETADMAIKSALTGHLLLSTLHTNDAAGAVTRLADMGVEPFLIASSVVACAAQRLVRRICPHCKEKYDVPADLAERMGLDEPVASRGNGCSACQGTGTYGRVALLEVLTVTDRIRDLILAGESSDVIAEAARAEGMTTLRDSGLCKVSEGVTTIEEVLRVTTEF